MELEVDDSQILSARRIGLASTNPTIPRQMVTTLQPELRELVMKNLKNLKGKKNIDRRSYRVSKQIPEQWVEENRKLKAEVTRVKQVNRDKDEREEKDKIEVKNRNFFINNKLQKKVQLKAPSAIDVFPEKGEQDKLDKIKFVASQPIEESGSIFTAYALKLQ